MPKTRKDGDGTFRKKPNGRIEYMVSYGNDIYGKRIRKSFSGKNETECRRKAKEYEKQLANQKVTLTECSLSYWLDNWVETYKSKTVQPSTYKEYKYIIEIIKTHKISNMKLNEIKPIHISDFFNSKTDYSKTVIKKLRFILNGAFEAGIDNDLCYKNPVRHASIPNKKQEEKTAYSPSEIQIIHNFALNDDLFGLPMLILLHTGIRSGELRALKYNDIDIDSRSINITHSIKRDNTIGPPKNGKPRCVPFSVEFAEILKSKIKTKNKQLYIIGDEPDYTTASGLRSRYQAFFRRMNKASETKIEMKPPHCIRHTYSTDMQRAGVPVAIVSAILGHSSTDVTDKYTHLDNIEDLRNAIDKIAKKSTTLSATMNNSDCSGVPQNTKNT